MAAINGSEVDEKGQAVLHTQTVSLSEVRKNLGEWREALLQEYRSLTEVNKAVKPVRREDIQQRFDVEFAPGKLVATIKAPSGKKKARIVVCGNLVEPSLQEQEEEGEGASTHGTRSKGYEHYASGIDGTVVRSVLRRASHCGWTGAATDVRTAFLLAPRRSKGGEKLVVRPPKILIESQIIDEGEWWEVEKALYGLQTSPADWSAFRDAELSKWSWTSGTKRFWLARTEEANLWQIRSLNLDAAQIEKCTKDAAVVGYVVVYVDDLLVLGEKPTVQAFLDQVRATWTCSEPEWVDDNLKFCGFEVTRRGSAICINQQAYAKELCARHECRRSRPTPVSTTMAAAVSELDMEAPQSQNPAMVKQAQSLTGELLWLAVRTRPDLSYVVSLVGRLSTRHPEVAVQLGKEAIGYVFGTVDKGLEYGVCEETRRHGGDSYLPFTRSMRRLECFADVSFAPNAGKSIQGIVAMYGGAPVQWESSRQSCIALSTAEGELYSYMEGVAMAESVGAILEILEDVPKRSGWKFPEQEVPDEVECDQMEAWSQTPDYIQKILYGDSTAAIAVASTPDGTWRTRHLRLRCNGLRERIQQGSTWAIRHLPGTELVADFLTKPITVKARWPRFFAFMKMTSSGEESEEGIDCGSETEQGQGGQDDGESWKQGVKKIALAGAGVAALSRLSPGDDEKLKAVKTLSMGALAAFVAVKTFALKKKWESRKKGEPRIQAVRVLPMGGSQRISPGRDRRSNEATIIRTRWPDARLDHYADNTDPDHGDYWEFFAHRGMLRRHHTVPRCELFGHAEGHWADAPVRRQELLLRRRTTILKMNELNEVYHVHDGWAFPDAEDQVRPMVCDEPWVGFTDFAFPRSEPLDFFPPTNPETLPSGPHSEESGSDGRDSEGPSTGGSTTPEEEGEVEAPQSVEHDDRNTWLTCGTTCPVAEEPEESEGESGSSEAESEDAGPMPALKVIYHRRDGEDGEEREVRRCERSRSRDDDDGQRAREEEGHRNDPGESSTSRERRQEERTRRNLATADLDSAIPPDDMIHVPAHWVEGMEDSIEQLLEAERLPEENQRRRADEAQRRSVVRHALQRLGVPVRSPEEVEQRGSRDGDRREDDRGHGEPERGTSNPDYMDEILAAERDEMEESLGDLVRRRMITAETADQVRLTAEVASHGGRCPAAVLEAVDLHPTEGMARMDVVVRGPVSGFAAWHVRGVARRDVSRCVHNNPEATRHDEIPPEPTAAEVEEPREDPAPWNAAEGEWDGSTVEVMSTEEAQSWARRACLHLAEYQMFRQRMQNSRRNYVAAMLKLGIEITEENEANNSIIQTTVEVEEPEQEEPEPEEQEQEWISDDEEAEEETNVSWDPEWNEERPRISALRIDEVSEGEETESIRVLRRESTSRGWTIGKVVRPWIWGIAAGLPRQVAGQPEEDPGGQRLFWMMTTAMIFSYTVVVLLVALFCLWWWNRRSDYDYGRMIGDEGVPDRLWRWTEDDAVPGGVYGRDQWRMDS